MIRDHRKNSPADEQARVEAEEGLDRLIAIIRGGCAKLAAYCAQAAGEGTFTARQAHQLLIAAGAPEVEFAALSDRPQERTRALTELLNSPGPVEVKLRVLAGSEAAGALHDLTGIMDRIAQAVHQAILDVYGSEGTSPVAYALAGARVLALFGVPMIPQAGQIVAITKTGTQPIGYWAWMARDPAAEPVAGIEIADFAMRHLPAAITDAGITWDLQPLALWYCGPVSDLASFGIRYDAEEGSREAVEQHAPAGTAETVDRAVLILSNGGPGGARA